MLVLTFLMHLMHTTLLKNLVAIQCVEDVLLMLIFYKFFFINKLREPES